MTTVGEFLVEKLGNMHRWLREEGFTLNWDARITTVTATMMAVHLRDELKADIDTRNFDAFAAEEFAPVLNFVRERPALHDKFWRYLELFSESVE